MPFGVAGESELRFEVALHVLDGFLQGYIPVALAPAGDAYVKLVGSDLSVFEDVLGLGDPCLRPAAEAGI